MRSRPTAKDDFLLPFRLLLRQIVMLSYGLVDFLLVRRISSLFFCFALLPACNGTASGALLDANNMGIDKAAPTFIYPNAGNPLIGLSQTLVWTNRSGVGKYSLRLFGDSARTQLVGEYTAGTNTLNVVFPDSKTYYYTLSSVGLTENTSGVLHVLDAIYVYCAASTVCSDTDKIGTKNLPFQTIEGALSRSQQLDANIIRVAARDTSGTAAYVQNVLSLAAGKSMYGGYSPDFTTRDTVVYKTIVANTAAAQPVLVGTGITKATVIDGFTLRGILNIDYAGQRLLFSNNAFELNGASGTINLTNSSPTFRNNTLSSNVVGNATSGIFISNTFTSAAATEMMLLQSYSGGTLQSRAIVAGNAFYTNSGNTSRYAIKVKDTNSSAIIMKNFIDPGQPTTCIGIGLDTNPTNMLVSGNTIITATCGSDGRPVELKSVTGGTTNAFHNNILIAQGSTTNKYVGYEFAGSATPELTKNIGFDGGGGGGFLKWFVNGASPTTFTTLGSGNTTTGSLSSIFVDWDGADNNAHTADNNQSLLASSADALNQGIACSVSLGTKFHNWGPGGDSADCELRFPGSTYTGGFCQATLLKDVMEISGDGIGNDNGICEAGETCLYNPNMGAYWGHGNYVDTGCDVSGIIAGVTIKKFASNGY